MPDSNKSREEALEALPGGVKLSWGIVKKPSRGPKGELSIPQIVQAAIAIADQDGLSAVSMSRVAQSLGFTPMSLYRYVSSKDDLILLMQDAICDIPIPPERSDIGWREEMGEFVRESVRIFKEHPWYADFNIQGIPLTPNLLRIVDWGLRMMKDFPINDFEKMSFVLLLSSYARAMGMIERDLNRLIKDGGSLDAFGGLPYTAALKELIKPDHYPHLYPVLMSGAYTGEAENTIGDDLDFGLERVLDGIEQYVNMKRAMQNKNSDSI